MLKYKCLVSVIIVFIFPIIIVLLSFLEFIIILKC